MITPVSKETELIWAELCVALWPHASVDSMLQEMYGANLVNNFLYSFEDEYIAFISLSLRGDYVEGTKSSPVGYIEGIYVKPEHQGKGVAKELIEFAKKFSRENGCLELASDCLLENEDSRRFHNRIGFKEANTIVHFTMEL